MADALSRSKRNSDPQDVGHKIMEESIHVITRSSILPTEEINKWHAAQREDPGLREIIQHVQEGTQRGDYFLTQRGLLYKSRNGQNCLMVPTSLRQQIIRNHHDVPMAGHVGIRRTLETICKSYYWRGMGQDVKIYVLSCPECQMMKSDNRKRPGLLQPIPIPARKWEQITTDLVTDLPVSDGYTAIAVFVDRLSKMVHFAPCTKEITAERYAQLFVDHVFCHHGMPEVVISDRDP